MHQFPKTLEIRRWPDSRSSHRYKCTVQSNRNHLAILFPGPPGLWSLTTELQESEAPQYAASANCPLTSVRSRAGGEGENAGV